MRAEHYFAQADFNNDGTKEYLIVDDNVLSVLNQAFKTIKTINIPASIYYTPSIYNSKKYKNLILLTNTTKSQVYPVAGKLLNTVIEGKSSAILVKSKNKEYIVSAMGQELIFTLLE
jgi:predicted oxidoreductase (fatty acid repression mutant protein)